MKKLLVFLFAVNIVFASDSLKIATYNILNYSGDSRSEYLRVVADSLAADILVVQEILSQEAVDSFQISVLGSRYATIPFHDGYDSDNHIFFLENKVRFLRDAYISTSLRDIAEYTLLTAATDDTLRIYSVHLKASTGTDNEQQRLAECTALTDHVGNLPSGSFYIVVGDMNFYDSGEPGYQKLLEKFVDPLNLSGSASDDWHDNEAFAYLHTQSPRVEQFGGGAYGGLDDRFDIILNSPGAQEKLADGTYLAMMNDGNHFNLSINDGRDSPLADALYYGSDHLPVSAVFIFDENTGFMEEGIPQPSGFRLGDNYPDPFNPSTVIPFFISGAGTVSLDIFSINGELVKKISGRRFSAGEHSFEIDMNGFSSGYYYYRMNYRKEFSTGRMLLLK